MNGPRNSHRGTGNTNELHRIASCCSCMRPLWARSCLWILVLASTRRGLVRGLAPPSSNRSGPKTARSRLDFSPASHGAWRSDAIHSSLFRRQSKSRQKSTPTSSTARQMVLTTPEAIIEKASTQKLLDELIDESVRTVSRKPVMMQFDPSSSFIWRRWKGTIFSETWTSCVRNMIFATFIYAIFGALGPRFKENLQGFQILWGQLLSVTTFTLTFFLNQSYALWRKCYELSRRLQGRLNDLGMTLAAHAARKTPASPSEPATYTSGSRQLLELMARYIRLFNLLTYASFTRSHRPILTPRGMRRLVERGLMTPTERQVLVEAEIPATQRHNAIILWIIRCFMEGRNAGHVLGGSGFENQFLEKIHVIRAQYGAIGDELQGRMPLAYAHIVQVLVDVILWMYPVMAFSNSMTPALGILGTGFLTMSYQGLFDLAKQFLDPYDNENYGKGDDPLCVDTLIAETNSGSVRWLGGFNMMPFSSQRIKDGELFDYILPLRGYSVEELEALEEEKAQKERELQEKRDRDEAERARIAEMERLRNEQKILNTTKSFNAASNSSLFVNAAVSIDNNVTPSPSAANQSQAQKTREHNVSQTQFIDIASETQKDDEKEGVSTSINANATGNEAMFQGVTNFRENNFKPTDLAGATIAAAVAASSASTFREKTELSTSALPEEPTEVNGVYPQMMLQPDFNFFDIGSAKWFDEVGDDGQEYRLSQMMADEAWEEEAQYQEELKQRAPKMSFEEYKESVVELIEDAAAEIRETRDILGSSSDADLEPTRRRKQMPIKYDQTRLDGISQLWGLPPNDLSALEVIEEPIQVTGEENSFDTIMQLWGKPPGQVSQQEGAIIGNNFRGVSQLWDQTGASGFSELPWMNEIDTDGKEFRLSQMLADEDWVDDVPQAIEAPLSLEDYSKKVNEVFEDVEKELKETEAILNASPGADSYDTDVGDNSVEEKEEELLKRSDRPIERPLDASSEIRAEVQAAYDAAKEEEAKIELALLDAAKEEDIKLGQLFIGEEEESEMAGVDEDVEFFEGLSAANEFEGDSIDDSKVVLDRDESAFSDDADGVEIGPI